MARLFLPCAALATVLVSSAAHAQNFVVDGVIHDALTLAPLSGVAVFIRDDATGVVLSPGELVDPAAQGQVTGPDGKYTLAIRTPQRVFLSLERPSEQFTFPSITKPPLGVTEDAPFGGMACNDTPCPNGQLSSSTVPIDRSPYALRFDSRSGPSARNNHIPIDALQNLIQVRLSSDHARARIGQIIGLTIETTNPLPQPISDGRPVLVLPEGLRYIEGSARGLGTSSNGQTFESPLTLVQSDLQLRFPRLVRVGVQPYRLLARVVAKKHGDKLELRSYIERGGGVVISNEAVLRIAFDEDPVFEQSTIFGSVFCEDTEGRKNWRDTAEEGLFGARVYLDSGYSAATDIDGLFHFSNVPQGMRLLKLDTGSLPPGSEPLGPTRVQLHLTPGVPAKVRFPIKCEYDVVEDPTRIARGAKQAELAAQDGQLRELELSVDFEARSYVLGGRAEELLSPKLSGHPSADDPLRLRFIPELDATRSVTRWLIRVEEVDQKGRTVRPIKEPLTGRGLPPPFVDLLIDRSGAYRAQLEIEAGDYDLARSAPIDVVTSTATKKVVEEKKLLARLSTEADAKKVAAELTAVDRLLIEGHWEEAPDAVEKSRAFAERVKAVLEKAGIDAVPMEVVAKGAEEPIAPSISPRARKQNRRVEL
jgi:hypothetical protein